MVNTTLAMGHHAENRRTAKNYFSFHTVAVHPVITIHFFVTGEDDITRFDSRRYRTAHIRQSGIMERIGQSEQDRQNRTVRPGQAVRV